MCCFDVFCMDTDVPSVARNELSMPQLFALITRFKHKRNIDVGEIQPIEIVESDEKVAPVNLLKKLIIKRE